MKLQWMNPFQYLGLQWRHLTLPVIHLHEKVTFNETDMTFEHTAVVDVTVKLTDERFMTEVDFNFDGIVGKR